MEKKERAQKLQQEWERAIEQAHENSARSHPLSDEMLDSAAGLEIKSGVHASQWTQSYSCNGGCTDGMC